MVNAIGRFLISAIFIITGIQHLLHWHEKSASVASKGLPAPDLFLFLAVVLMIGGGVLLVSGTRTRLGAIALLVFLIPVTLLYHNFWAAAPAEYQGQFIQFLKNLAIMGGLVVLLAPSRRG